MGTEVDEQTRDEACSVLKLNDELLFSPQVRGGEVVYLIEAPSKGAFYRVGHAEYVFISLLDGELTVAQALTLAARQLGVDALTQAKGLQVVQWLLDAGLASFRGDQKVSNRRQKGDSPGNYRLAQSLNPFWAKFPLGCPTGFFKRGTLLMGWLFSPIATVMGLMLIVAAVFSVRMQWESFAASSVTVLSPANWLWLGLAWLGLKVLHEIGHGIACHFYGGEVRETGLILILFAPMAYVDVTSCWRFTSRWKRIHVAAAGMQLELTAAALAVFWWGWTDSTLVAHLLYNVIVMASVSTLLFNANPLMRFDGYYILSDILQIPNLATEASRYLKQWTSRLFFGSAVSPPREAGVRGVCVRCYGFAAFIWKMLICISLTAAASVLLHGAGLVLAIAGALIWFGKPVYQGAKEALRRFHEARVSFIRAIGVALVGSTATCLVLVFAPWPGSIVTPGIVDYSERCVIRGRASGFVERIHVHNGQLVQKGTPLLDLRNEELLAQERELLAEREKGVALYRIAMDDRDAGAVQIAESNLKATEERLSDVRRRAQSLRLIAPVSGKIISRELRQRLGTYVAEGAELLVIGNEDQKEFILSIDQEDIESITACVGSERSFRIGNASFRGRLESIDPRASTELPHPALSAAVGGELAVTSDEENERASERLTEPRFRGTIKLSPSVCQAVGAGQQGYARLGIRDLSIGSYLWSRMTHWFESVLTPTLRR